MTKIFDRKDILELYYSYKERQAFISAVKEIWNLLHPSKAFDCAVTFCKETFQRKIIDEIQRQA